MNYFDFHIHLTQLETFPVFSTVKDYSVISCCLTENEFYDTEKLVQNLKEKRINFGAEKVTVKKAFGVHPQFLNVENLKFLASLLENKKIDYIGEIGLDFFNEELKQTKNEQIIFFEKQLELALKFKIPIIIHERKAVNELFKYKKELSLLPKVIFHNWSGSFMEAQFFLKNKVNAFFSFGNTLLTGKKSAVECVKLLPLQRIVFETDAPFQKLKENLNQAENLVNIYEKASLIRGIDFTQLNFEI